MDEAASPAVRRAAAYLRDNVQSRTGLRWDVVSGAATPDDILVGVERADGVPRVPRYREELAVSCRPGRPVCALAGSDGVAVAVAGRLARLLDMRPGRVSLDFLSLVDRPAFPVRGFTFASHRQNNTHDKWDLGHWDECLTELAAWGTNTAIVYPLHPARWRQALPFDKPPWFGSPSIEAEFNRQQDVHRALPGLCRELGLRYGLWLPVNDVFPEQVKRAPGLSTTGSPYVCPSRPAARRAIRAIRERLFRELPEIDVLLLPSADDGGCPGCADCAPWGQTYIELVVEQAEQVRARHPACMLWLSLQGLPPAEVDRVLGWLDRERPPWVEAVCVGPSSDVMTLAEPGQPGEQLSLGEYRRSGEVSGPLHRIRAATPGSYRLLHYPDITHVFRCQYPVIDMDAAVQRVWMREDGPAVRPQEFARIHAATSTATDGSSPYTEGDTDDVVKSVWAGLAWNPHRSAADLVAEYSRWHFSTPAGAELIGLIEAALHARPEDSAAVDQARALLSRTETTRPDLLENWRWLTLRIAVLMLAHIAGAVQTERHIATRLRYRIEFANSPDPFPLVRQAIRDIEGQFAQAEGLTAEIVWTRDRIFSLHRMAVRGVGRLQNSYAGLDALLARWKSLLERLDDSAGPLSAPVTDEFSAALGQFQNHRQEHAAGIAIAPGIDEFEWEIAAPPPRDTRPLGQTEKRAAMSIAPATSDTTDRVAAELGVPSTHDAWLAELAALDPAPAPLPGPADLPDIFAHLNIPADDQAELLELLPQAQRPEARWLIERCRHLLTTNMGRTEPLSRWPELPGAFGRYAYAYVYLATLADVRRYHAKRGIPDEVSWETLADLGRHMAIYRKIRGAGGLHARPWLTRHFRGTIYSLGRLQFTMHRQSGVEAGSPIPDGEWVLGVHIPEAGPMTPAACAESFRRAREFYPRHFSEHTWRYAVCSSWLLDPQLAEYLPESSNIVAFGRLFSPRGQPSDGDAAMLEFVFHREGPVPLAELPQRTTLERAVVQHRRAGRHWQIVSGYLAL